MDQLGFFTVDLVAIFWRSFGYKITYFWDCKLYNDHDYTYLYKNKFAITTLNLNLLKDSIRKDAPEYSGFRPSDFGEKD
jgi:hypothetical protein